MDPSDNACIEVLRPKTVPDGLLALGTVVQVSEIQVKLQITGGILCLVDRFSVSQSFTKSLEEHENTYGGDKAPPKLSQLFKRGQQYVCKIVEKRTRKGYADAQDIIATIDPESIHEDILPKTMLSIPQVPLQCAVQSVEDHGYQMDLGFKGLTGFLSFEESNPYCSKHNDGKKFIVGQVIRCCLKDSLSDDTDLRVVPLALKKASMKQSVFTQEKVSEHMLTANSILPGSRSFLTVMKVVRNGLVVNFMNEFAGFVDLNHLKEEWHTPKENYKISDQLDCTVLYYNHITKTFALSLKPKKKYRETLDYFLENFHVGKVIKNAKVAYINGTKSITFKVQKNFKAVAHVRDAFDEDISTMTKDELLTAIDSSFLEDSAHRCRIKSINLADLILVLSLRQDFLNQPFMSVEELKPADIIEATVKKYVKDGIIVSFGLNLRAIILNTDLHDYVSAKSYKRYPIGKVIKCRILKIDLSKQPPRIYLTNKEQLMDPELNVISSYDKSLVGKSTQATVFKIAPSGLIVELFNNVKGFIPRRFLSTVLLKDLADLYKVGQVTSCVVYRADPVRRSLLLGVIPFEEIMKMKKEKKLADRENKEVKKLTGKYPTNKRPAPVEENNDENKSSTDDDDDDDDNDDNDEEKDEKPEVKNEESVANGVILKSRRQRSEEAKLREEKLREKERDLLDPNRTPQSIHDFEKLLLKTPNSADVWTKYSKFFLDNVETEKARIVCRRALKTINFRMEKEKLKVWLHLIKLEAKYGGTEKVKATIEEAAQTNDRLTLLKGTAKVLSSCGELDEAEKLHETMLRTNSKSVEVWIDYILFCMEQRNDIEKARTLFDKANKVLLKSDLVILKSRFAQFEFRYGEVERGKTIFDNLLSDNPKRTDLWKVYEAMVKKHGLRQIDTPEVCQQNEQLLARISESIELVSKKGKKRQKVE